MGCKRAVLAASQRHGMEKSAKKAAMAAWKSWFPGMVGQAPEFRSREIPWLSDENVAGGRNGLPGSDMKVGIRIRSGANDATRDSDGDR